MGGADAKEKMDEMKKIDEYLGERDLIDLSTLSTSSKPGNKVVCHDKKLSTRKNRRNRKRTRRRSSNP